MSLFAVLHLWAYTWKVYVSGHPQTADVTDFYGNGKATYQGGPFGVKAILDALNPMDLIKAVGRGFRWLFVGRKLRMLDPSYQDANIGLTAGGQGHEEADATSYGGAAGAMAGGRTGRYGRPSDEEEEVLLDNTQPNPTTRYSRRSGDIGTTPSHGDKDDEFARYDEDSWSHQETGIASYHSPHGSLQEQIPMPMPDPYQPPPLHDDDYDHYERR